MIRFTPHCTSSDTSPWGQRTPSAHAIRARALAPPASPTSEPFVEGLPRPRRRCHGIVIPRFLLGTLIDGSQRIPASKMCTDEAYLKQSGQLHLNRWILLHFLGKCLENVKRLVATQSCIKCPISSIRTGFCRLLFIKYFA